MKQFLIGLPLFTEAGVVTAATAATETVKSAATLQIGSITDVGVIDHNGKPLHFYADLVRGKAVAIQFVFASCSAICRPLSAIFSELQHQFADQPVVQLISITVDPGNDASDRFESHATKFAAGPLAAPR